MKPKSLIIALLFILPFTVFSQIRIELKNSFALPVQSRVIGSQIKDNFTESYFKNSFGYGFDNTLNLYKSFSEKIQAGIGFSYHSGNTFKSAELVNHDNNGDLKTSVYRESYSNYISVEPKVKFLIFNKFDINLGLITLVKSSVFHENLRNNDINNQNTIYSIQEIKGRVSLGFLTGLDYKIYSSERFEFSLSLNYRNIDFVTNKAEMILYEVDGVNRLESLNMQSTKTEYVKNIYPDDNKDNAQAMKELEYKLPFNSVSLGINLNFKF